jgi:hypothetical protein
MHGLCFILIANELCTARSISLLGQLETGATVSIRITQHFTYEIVQFLS